uniref:RGS domain-containing protein n=2 Tax=Spongospora subterranea TaxID=70186 RepID=A0A0H5RUH0_9EUKA|eukprot:CRZ12374.1 hypothetical protein [Spongospora subterranea]
MSDFYSQLTFKRRVSIAGIKIEVVHEKSQSLDPVQKWKPIDMLVFKAAQNEVLATMRTGAFERYLQNKTNNQLWMNYLQSRQAHNMYESIIASKGVSPPIHRKRSTITNFTGDMPGIQTGNPQDSILPS